MKMETDAVAEMEIDAIDESETHSGDGMEVEAAPTGFGNLPYHILDTICLPLDILDLYSSMKRYPSLRPYLSSREFLNEYNNVIHEPQVRNFTYFFKNGKHLVLAMVKGKPTKAIELELEGFGNTALDLIQVWNCFFVLSYERGYIGEGGLILYNFWTDVAINFETPCYEHDEKEWMWLTDKFKATKLMNHPHDALGWIFTYFHPLYRQKPHLNLLFATMASESEEGNEYSVANGTLAMHVHNITPNDTAHPLWRIMQRTDEVVVASMRGSSPVWMAKSGSLDLGDDFIQQFAHLEPVTAGQRRFYILCDSNDGHLVVVMLLEKNTRRDMGSLLIEKVWLFKTAPNLAGGYRLESVVLDRFIPARFCKHRKFSLHPMEGKIVFSFSGHGEGIQGDLWRCRVIWYDTHEHRWDSERLETKDVHGLCSHTMRGTEVVAQTCMAAY